MDLVQANTAILLFLDGAAGQAGQEIELAMDVEVGRLVGGKAIQDTQARAPDLVQAV